MLLQLTTILLLATPSPVARTPPPTPSHAATCLNKGPTPAPRSSESCPGAIAIFESATDADRFAISADNQAALERVPGLATVVLLPAVVSRDGAMQLLAASPLIAARVRHVGLNQPWRLHSSTPTQVVQGPVCDPTPGPAARRPLIAVVDTGVDLCDPAFTGLLWTNPGEGAGDEGEDDDGSGYIDDYFGASVVGNSSDLSSSSPHGNDVARRVATTIMANVATPTDGPGLLFCKFTDQDTGCTSDLIKCLGYVKKLVEIGAPIVAVNLSSGSPHGYVDLGMVLEEFASLGVVVVTSAGNAGLNVDVAPAYPTSFGLRHLVTVAAGDASTGLKPFSNHGRYSVELAAPGASTSFAGPVASALIGLAAKKMPHLTSGQRRTLLLTSGAQMPTPIANGEIRTVTNRIATWTGADGIGVDNCAEQRVWAPLRPIPRGEDYEHRGNGPIRFEVFSANCATAVPAGEVEVWSGENLVALLTLADDLAACADPAQCWDQRGGDAVYSAQWPSPSPGLYTARHRPVDDTAPYDIVVRVCP